jgi:hypothetical protein
MVRKNGNAAKNLRAGANHSAARASGRSMKDIVILVYDLVFYAVLSAVFGVVYHLIYRERWESLVRCTGCGRAGWVSFVWKSRWRPGHLGRKVESISDSFSISGKEGPDEVTLTCRHCGADTTVR